MSVRSTLLALAACLLMAGPSAAAEPCVSDETSLCLFGRFKVSITYSLKGSPSDPMRPARVVTSQGDSALFHFPELGPENWEFLAKGVNLCGSDNPMYAFLVGAATDREYSIEILDTVKGDRKTFRNPLLGRPILFRTAFADCGATSAASAPSDEFVDLTDVAAAQDAERAAGNVDKPDLLAPAAQDLERPATTPAPPTPAPCRPTSYDFPSTRLCLLDGRFAVQMEYRLQPNEEYRAAEVVPDPSSPDSGLFFYPEFGRGNWELLVKGADLCNSNGFFTLIAAAATDRDFRVAVTDSVTGETRRYENRQGDFPPLFREAFATCNASNTPPSTFETARQLRATGFGDYVGKQSPSRREQKGSWENVYFDPAEHGAICLDGSTYQASFHRGSTNHLLIYLEGGGACWDYASCWDFGTATTTAGDAFESGIIDFSNPSNPFHDWNILYVPYCDGSVFTGDHVADYNGVETFHHGLRNLSAAISTAAETLPNPDRVVVSGSSAGGYGTFAGYAVSRIAYPETEILSFNDSGPGLQNPYASEDVAARSANWDFERRFPATCWGCNEQFTYFYDWIFDHDPLARVSLFSFRQDGVISLFLGLDGGSYEGYLLSVTGRIAARWPGRFARYFALGESHTILGYGSFYDFRVNDVSLRDWTRAFLDDAPEWTDVVECDPAKDCPRPPPVCGNGVSEYGELCDDGNLVNGDGCETDCRPTSSAQYVDNGDGTLTDTATGLTWEKKTANDDPSDPHDVGGRYTWSAPDSLGSDGSIFSEFLPALNGGNGQPCFAGHCDWRLPTPEEIHDIWNCRFVGPPFSAPCIDPAFGPTTTEFHWSSESLRTEIGRSRLAFGQPFGLGQNCMDYSCYVLKGRGLAVRAVRGGTPPPPTTRWRDQGDGTVLDTETGLVWEKKTAAGPGPLGLHDVGRRFTWSSSEPPRQQSADGTLFTEFLPGLNGGKGQACFAGHCDWRIPTSQELPSIVQEGCILRPCIHPVFGPTAADGTWVSSYIDYGVPDGILVPLLGFYDGSAIWDSASSSYFARAVRNVSR